MAKSLNPKVTKRKSDGEATKKAAKAKKAATETLAEAWERIFKLKNDDATLEKLNAVKAAMDAGTLGREPESAGKKFSKAEAERLFAVLKERYREELLQKMADEVPDNYHLITTKAALLRLVQILNAEKEIVFDVETTGVDVFGGDFIVGHVLTAVSKDLHFYIPTKHLDNPQQLDHDYVMETLKPVYENPFTLKIAHNAKFDMHMLANEGVTVAGKIWDTQIAAHVLNENEDRYALKILVTKYLKIESQTYGDLFTGGFHNVTDLRVALAYAAKDGDVTRRLRDFQVYHMKRTGVYEYFINVEQPLIPVVLRMERAGLFLDPVRAKELADEQHEILVKEEKLMREKFGVDDTFNFGSPPQLTDLLYNQLKLDRFLIGTDVKKTKKGDYATDVKALAVLAEFHDGVSHLQKYRKASKSFGTYFDSMPKRADKHGYVHGTFDQDGTKTGRFSSSEPNLQNIPPAAKPMFIAPPGQVILSGDFSQQEPRIMTHSCGDPILTEIYRSGQDLYTNAAAKMWNLPPEQCGDGSKYRKMMKGGMLATFYGTGAKGLSGMIGISVDEAEKFIADFHKTYSVASAFSKKLSDTARKQGYITMLGGRKRRLPDANSRDWKMKSYSERQAKNSYVQGGAGVQTKMTMIALDEWCRERSEATGKVYTLAFSIHDEVGAYVPKEITREEVDEFVRIMVETVPLNVPNKVDPEISTRWGEGHKVDEWFEKNLQKQV